MLHQEVLLEAHHKFTSLFALLAACTVYVFGCASGGRRSFTRGELPGIIAFGTWDGIEVLEPGTSQRFPRRIFRRGQGLHATWDQKAKRIIFFQEYPHSGHRRGLYSVTAKGGDPRHIIGGPGKIHNYPSVSPDGKGLAFLAHAQGSVAGHERPPPGKLMLMDMETKRIRVLFPTAVLSSRPSWSPDSKRLMFATTSQLGDGA